MSFAAPHDACLPVVPAGGMPSARGARRFSTWMAGMLGWVVVVSASASAGRAAEVKAEAEGKAGENAADRFWVAHVEPVLKARCVECHHPTKPKSGLDLTTLGSALRGGDRGASVLPGRPDASHLMTFLGPDAEVRMPPGNRKKLSEEEIGTIRHWIEMLGTGQGPAAALVEANPVATPGGPVSPPAPRWSWLPPADMPLDTAVDRFLELAWDLDGTRPAGEVGDGMFARRVTLDLAGRLPTSEEVREFLARPAESRRAWWVDRLLAGDEYPRRMREVFDVVLMGRRGPGWEDRRAGARWFAWLEDGFRRNRPWDAMVRECLVARPERDEDRGASWFLYERENNAQAVAESVAPVVFGVQVKCAQCHDHMVAREIKQAHYWGMVAAFNRSRNVETTAGSAVAESAVGGFVSFANLRKESQPARLVFFNGRGVDEPWPKEGEKEKDEPVLYRVPPPAGKDKPEKAAVPVFSRRAAFADAVTRDNPLLARAMVNRVWALLFGRGLVHPVDLMDSKHPASHPELLEWLGREFALGGYDVKALVRGLCLTRAYRRDARWEPGVDVAGPSPASSAGKPGGMPKIPAPESFARGLDKPLTGEQWVRALLVATGNAVDASGKVAGLTETELRRAWVKQFPEVFQAEYNATLQQALFLSNSGDLDPLLEPRDGNLAARLMALSDVRVRVSEAFASVLGREPASDERAACEAYLAARPAAAGVKQLLWALVTGAEFQLRP